MNVKVELNRNFRECNTSKKRYVVMKGSAGSGKSTDTATNYILRLGDPKYKGANLLCVRKIEESNKDSTYAELCKAIYKIYGDNYEKYWKINKQPLEIENKVTGNCVLFRGVADDRQREKLKSINFKRGKLVWVWVEEATELLETDVDIIDDRLRGKLDNPILFYQIKFTFNPISALHWIKRKYFDKPSDMVLTHSSTYKENRFIDDEYNKRMERRKEEDPDGYRVYGLGEWGESGGLILPKYLVEEFDTDITHYDYVRYAQDFGFNHANCILELCFKDGELYVNDELYVHEKDTTEIIELQQTTKPSWNTKERMWCDNAEPDRIKMWVRAGWPKAKGVEKGAGSVKAQIDFLKGIKIHIHPRCVNTLSEVQQWKYIKDNKTGLYTDEPVPIYDDAMACLRYGVEDTRKAKKWLT